MLYDDQRQIPQDLQPYLESPPRQISNFSLETANKLTLTHSWFENKWSFVYFSHLNCLPQCQSSFETLSKLHNAFASNHIQLLVIGLDQQDESITELTQFLNRQNVSVPVATADEATIVQLAKTFIALFLKTDYSDGSYLIEQEHHIFIVDPKGRVYATFRPPYDATKITMLFSKIRLFYAKTE
ncbi:MAG: SCO family protein [Gammaproteobacteria bacterium]|nr:SCO family protein [Gammaproteobacteria bacterium]